MTTILVVDDEPDVVDYICDELELSGYAVSKAYDGVEAVMKVMDGGISAILMDIRMPTLDGINALKIIRRSAPQIPVVMFTGQAGQGDMLATNRLGAYTCLPKPMTSEKIVATLSKIVPPSQ